MLDAILKLYLKIQILFSHQNSLFNSKTWQYICILTLTLDLL